MRSTTSQLRQSVLTGSVAALFGLCLAILLGGCHPIYYFTDIDNSSLQPSTTLEHHRALTITPASLADPQQLLAISSQLISETFTPVGILTSPVTFPSGDQGIFAAFGFMGTARGYQLLYRIHGNTVELVESKISSVVWGLYDYEHPAQLEVLCLIDCKKKPNPTILKVVGAGHAGTGLFANGIFELLQITDEGLIVIFNGFEENWVVGSTPGSYHESYQYEFVDVASDANKVIVKRGQTCDIISIPTGSGLKDVNCIPVVRKFSFDGNKYK